MYTVQQLHAMANYCRKLIEVQQTRPIYFQFDLKENVPVLYNVKLYNVPNTANSQLYAKMVLLTFIDFYHKQIALQQQKRVTYLKALNHARS